MPCEVVVYDTKSKAKTQYVLDEDNTTRLVEDDRAASKSGEYTDASGKSFSVDWTQYRLIRFARQMD